MLAKNQTGFCGKIPIRSAAKMVTKLLPHYAAEWGAQNSNLGIQLNRPEQVHRRKRLRQISNPTPLPRLFQKRERGFH